MNLPSKDSAVGKTVVVALWVGLSAVAASVLSSVAGNPQLFGALTVVINGVAVLVKQLADKEVKNW